MVRVRKTKNKMDRAKAAILSLVACLLFVSCCQAIVFEVEAHKIECFYEDVEEGDPLSVSYQVVKGGFLDIDVHIYSPKGLIYEAERETEGKFTATAETVGEYRFCFSNTMSTLTPKTISFNIFVGENTKKTKKPHTVLDPIEEHISSLSHGLEEVLSGQIYLKNREKASRDTNESTNARVLWWAVVEAIALVAVSAWQIYSLKQFFEVKRVI